MGKILILGILASVIFYFIVRKISSFKYNNLDTSPIRKSIIEITVPTFILQNVLKKTLITVGTGFLLLLIILAIASKFKLALIALPLSFYLIGQYFVFSNHVKKIKSQTLQYHTQTDTLYINLEDGSNIHIPLDQVASPITEIKSVQKNNNIQFGYLELSFENNKYYIPHILAENPQNKILFDRLKKFNKKSEIKLFPII